MATRAGLHEGARPRKVLSPDLQASNPDACTAIRGQLEVDSVALERAAAALLRIGERVWGGPSPRRM